MKTQFYPAMATVALLAALLTLAGCQTSDHRRVAVGPVVGPGSGKALGNKTRQYVYNSNIYLDVAIPVFDPGIPEDYNELNDKNIWPQLRRAEANRFAVMTKKALEKIAAFGNVSVVPTPQATADLYILGRIDHSNAEDIKLTIDVVDISGRRWDSETFEHRVSLGFFRDKQNKSNDPYEPVFDEIAEHVFNLLNKKSEADKGKIKQITDIRFAQSFSPETFSRHLSTDRKGITTLTGLPGKDDPMMARVQPLRVQDQMFIDRMQTQYEGFGAKTDDSYRLWQEKTLPATVAAREAETQTLLKGLLGGAAVILAGVNAKHDLSTTSKVATAAAALAGAYLIKESFGQNKEAKVHRATIDELGESLDIEMDPQVMELEDKTIELSGTAEEQYIQWQAHLKRIYLLQQTPSKKL